jgi:hypothetical protein
LFVGLGLYAVGSLGASIGSRKGASVAEYQYPGVSLTASPQVIAPSQTSTLTWSSTDVATCDAEGDWSGSKPLAGSQVVTVWGWQRGFFVLDCNGPDGPAGALVQVTTRQPITARAGVDQRQINVDDFTTEDAFAQTFTVGIPGWLTDINVQGSGINPYDQIAITRTTPGGAPDSSAVLTSTTVGKQAFSGNVRLPKQIFVLPGQKLAITVVAPNGRSDPADDYVAHEYSCEDPYPRGAYYSHDQNGAWTQQTGCDNAFSTYVIQRLKVGP